jgi:hypothetical protein
VTRVYDNSWESFIFFYFVTRLVNGQGDNINNKGDLLMDILNADNTELWSFVLVPMALGIFLFCLKIIKDGG